MEEDHIYSREELEVIKDDNPQVLVEIIVNLQQVHDRLTKQVGQLQEQVEQITGEQHRQAAPFRIAEKKKKASLGLPGNKRGHAGSYRKKTSDQIDEQIEVALPICPKCGGAVKKVRAINQIIEDIPQITPHITHLTTYSGLCTHCGRVRSTHPMQVSVATGAAGTHLGSRALSVCAQLQYSYGLTKRKVQRILKGIFNLSLTAGAVVHASHRAAKKLSLPFKALQYQLTQSGIVHSDETSWYVGQPKSWLWVFTNPNTTIYQVRNTRARSVIQEVIGENYDGVLISDCLNIYDDVNAVQQKCYAHHLKAISQAQQVIGEGQPYLQQVRRLLQLAMIVKSVKQELTAQQYQQCCQQLEQQADQMLLPARADPVEEKIVNRLRKQRDHLFTFLYHQNVDATNNLAERQLRPAVIARKVSCGNKTTKGAASWEILSSFAATYVQRNLSFAKLIQRTALLNPLSID